MANRLQGKFKSVHGTPYRVTIYDKDYAGAVAPMTVVGNGVVFKTNGDEKDFYKKPISLASCTLVVLDDSEAMDTFLDDLVDAEESTYFLIVERESVGAPGNFTVEFKGMILIDSMTINNEFKPIVSMEAVCGLSILKGVPYEWGGLEDGFFRPLRKVLYDAIKKNPVIEELYDAGDVIMRMKSNLEIDHAYYAANDGNIFETIYLIDYFFTISENIRENLSCYEVLERLLKKYHMRMTYDDGAYIIMGLEIINTTISPFEEVPYVTKDGTLGEEFFFGFYTKTIDDYELSGGNYIHEKGHRQVKILASKEGSNVYLAKDFVKTLADYSPLYFTAPPMIAATEFEILFKVQATILYHYSYPGYLKDNKIQYYLELYVKFTDQETDDVFYGYMFGNRVNAPGDAHIFQYGETELPSRIYFGTHINGTFASHLRLLFPPYANDRKVEIRYNLVFGKDWEEYTGPPLFLTTYDYRVTMDMGASPVGETQVPIPINAYISESKNTAIYTYDIYSSEMYGADGTRAVCGHDGIVARIPGWRLDSADAFEGLERAMATYMMKYLHKARRILTLPLNIKSFEGLDAINIPTATNRVTYLGNTYAISSFEQAYLDSVILIKAIRINTASEAEITTNSLITNRVPGSTEISNNLQGGGTQLYTKLARVKKEFIVTGGTLVLPAEFEIPPNAKYSSLVTSLDVLVDGALWSLTTGVINQTNGLWIGYVGYNFTTKTLTFGMELAASRVIVILSQNLVIDETITSI